MTDQEHIETLERLKRQVEMAIDMARSGQLRYVSRIACPSCGPQPITIGDFQIIDLKAKREAMSRAYGR